MDAVSPADRLTLSRDVARVNDRITALVSALGDPVVRARARSADPFGLLRHVAGQSTYRALVESEPPQHETWLRDALLRWVHELLQTRVGWDLAIDEADALHAVDERLGGPERGASSASASPLPRTFAEARAALVGAAHPAGAAVALERLADRAAPVAAVRKERRARRFEVARRLGLAHPWSLATTAKIPDFASAARALLDETDAIATHVRKEADKREPTRGRARSPADAVVAALARDAQEGWPARLGPRWLDEAFAPLVVRPFRPPPLPEALGGASFLRAAAAWGYALRLAGTAQSLPFALARDPYPVDAHRFGAVLALAVADPLFQRKKLGVSARGGALQARALGASLLFTARAEAVRFLLTAAEATDAAEYESLTARLFGVPLPPVLRDAWPDPDVDLVARFVATLDAFAFRRTLVERFDEDWFANPRAGAHLAAMASGPVFRGDPPSADAPRAIARAFEDLLG